MDTSEIFGARAIVYLNYQGELTELANILVKGLMLPGFDIQPSEDPPYEVYGSCEVLGFEVWLQKSNKIEGYPYSIEIETEHSLDEIFYGKLYDLSPWLARYISDICEIETITKQSRK
jgi:hypothetical protein